MVSQNWKNTNKSPGSFPRAVRDSRNISSGAPTPKAHRKQGNAFLGFVLLVVLHALILWLAGAVVESAEIVSWSLGVWHSVGLATLYVVWRSLALLAWGRVASRL